MRGTVYLLLLLISAGSLDLLVDGSSSTDRPVEELDAETFGPKVLEGPHPWLVQFYQTDSPHYERFAPEYRKVGTSLRGLIKVGAVDCKEAPQACIAAQIKALPTIQWYTWERRKNPYTGKWYKDPPVVYDGAYAAKAVTDFATGKLPASFVSNISSGASAESFLTAESKPKVVLFSSKKAISPLYRALSLQFRDRLQFAQASAADEDLCAQFGAKDFPSLFVQLLDGERVKYEGTIKAEPITAFLDPYAPEVEGEAGEEEADAKAAEEKAVDEELDDRSKWVKQLEASEFARKVVRDEDVWLVAFLADNDEEECTDRQLQWKEASGNLTGMVRTGELRVSKGNEAATLAERYGVLDEVEGPQCLAVLLFPYGKDKEEQGPEVFTGPMLGKELSLFAIDAVPNELVQHLTKSSIAVFQTTLPQKPKILLFSSKTETSPVYKVLAMNFHKYMSFGQIHSSQTELLEEFNVTKVPFVSFMIGRPSADGRVEYLSNYYTGSMKYPALAAFCNQVASFALGMSGAPAQDVEVPEISNDEDFEKHCLSRGRLCVIGLFKHLDLVDELQSVAAIWTEGSQYAFSWVDTAKAPGWPGQLGVSSAALPTVAVLSPAKKRVATLVEAFTAAHLQATLEGLLAGKVRTSPLEVMPSFSSSQGGVYEENAQPEEEPPVEEEEFSLEDILGVEVEGSDLLATKAERLSEVEKELEEEQAQRAAEEEAAAKAAKSSSGKKKKKKKKGSKKPKDEL